MVVVGGGSRVSEESSRTFLYHEGKICGTYVNSVLPVNMTRFEAAAAWYDDRLIYCGGTGNGRISNCVALNSQKYADNGPLSDLWRPHSEMTYVRRWFSLTAMPSESLDYYEYDDDEDVDYQDPIGGLLAVGGVGKKVGGRLIVIVIAIILQEFCRWRICSFGKYRIL